MNNTIKHLSCGGFAVLPLPQAVAVQAGQLTNTQQAELQVLASNNKCTGFGGFTKEVDKCTITGL